MAVSLTIFVALIFALSSIPSIHGFSSGAPDSACQTLLPLHGYEPQQSPFPYNLTFDYPSTALGHAAGIDLATLDIEGSPKYFKGFILVARKVGNGTHPDGIWDAIDTDISKAIDCHGVQKNALTHTSGVEKDAVYAKWYPYTNGAYEFFATVVLDYQTFWVEHKTGLFYANGRREGEDDDDEVE